MARNNSSRLGMPEQNKPEDAEFPASILELENNSLSFTVPTEFVELPSRGIYYPEGHLLSNKSVVEIRHMTAKDEDILSSRALLKQGIAIDRFLKSILVDRSIDIGSLLIGDKNAILIAARISGFGPEYDTKVICPMCFAHGRHIFNLGTATVNHGDEFGELEVSRNEKGNIIVVTPKTNIQVECKMLTGFHEKQIIAQRQRAEKQKLPHRSATNQLLAAIVSVNGNQERDVINSFVNDMPVLDSRYIRKAIEICSPDVEIHDFFECHECGASTDMEVPFTADFFWPR